MVFRILKYLLNLIAIGYMCVIVLLSTTFTLECEPCENVKGNIGYAVLYTAIYLISTTFFNFLVERFLEKRKTSKEFLFLLCISFIILAVTILISANIAYKDCCENAIVIS